MISIRGLVNRRPLIVFRWHVREGRTLFGLGLVSLAVYLPGLWWGLPHATSASVIHGWDVDSVNGMIVLSEFHNLFVVAKPDWWVAYPLFHYLVIGAVYVPYLAYLWLTGGLATPTGVYPYGFVDPVSAIATLSLLGRLVTVSMACGVVLTTYLTGRRIWDRSTGLGAALTVMLLTPMLYYSRTGNLDVPVLFWICLALYWLAVIITSGLTMRRAAWLGAVAACAVATKDQAYGALVPALAVLVLSQVWGSAARSQRSTLRNVIPMVGLLLLSGGLTYSVASGLVISPTRFVRHLHYILNFRDTFYSITVPQGIIYGHGGNFLRASTVTGALQLMRDFLDALAVAVSPWGLLLAGFGILATGRFSPFSRYLLLMVMGHIGLVILPVHHMQYRYAMFPAVVAAFFMARAVVVGWRSERLARWSLLGGAALAYLWLGAQGADLTYQMLFDARIAAGQCLARHLRPGDEVAYFGGVNQLPPLPAGVTLRLLPEDATAAEALLYYRPRVVLVSPDAWSTPGMTRSWRLAEAVYDRLQEGSIGYQRLAQFETPPWWGPVRFLSVINPPVQVFGLPDDNLGADIHC